MSEKLPNSQNRETVDKAIPSLTKEKITLKNSTKQKTESLKGSLDKNKSIQEKLDTPEMFRFRLNEINSSLYRIKILSRRDDSTAQSSSNHILLRMVSHLSRVGYLLGELGNSHLDFSRENRDLYNGYIRAMNEYLSLSKGI